MSTTNRLGADPDRLNELANRMAQAADTLDAIRHTIQSNLDRAAWHGDDGDRFRNEWYHGHSGRVAASVAALHEAARSLGLQADQQRGASGADGSSGAHPGPGPGWSAVPGGATPRQIAWEDAVLAFPSRLLDGFGHMLFLDDVRRFPDANLFRAGPLDALGIGFSVAGMLAEASRGELQWSTVGGVAWDLATVVNPYARALDTGIFIGTGLAEVLDDIGVQQGIIDYAVGERYGGDLSPSEAADLTKRYEGIGGYVNIAGDAAGAAWNKFTGLFR